MKNFKNNSSQQNRYNDKKKSDLRNDNKSSNFKDFKKDKRRIKNKNISDFNNITKKETSQKNDFRQSCPKEKNNNQSRSRSYRSKPSIDFSVERSFNSNQLTSSKNFDDWIWGKHAVSSCLNSDRPINRIWCTSDIYSSEKFYLKLKNLKSKGVLVEEVAWTRLTQITNGGVHQGIALQLASSKTLGLRDLILSAKSKSSKPILVALDGITDPHNLGAIIRSAEAFDCKGIIIPQRRSAGLTGTVAKVAAGALEHLPVSRVVNLNRALENLKTNGFLVIGLSGDGQLSISKFREKTPLVLVVGAEDKGISLLTQKKCDFLLSIPLKGKTSSLNASVAAAISLFHLTSK